MNFANCDMVGHTGVFDAAVKAVEVADDAPSKVVPAILAKGGFALITADHGNADHMFDVAWTVLSIRLRLTPPTACRSSSSMRRPAHRYRGRSPSDIAPTMLTMAGIEPPPR
ncbi:MAG: hypothetical protein ACLS3M_10845 [Collinsella sp.]